MSRLAVLPLIAGVALALTACGDNGPAAGGPLQGGGPAAASKSLDLCGVLTLDRAKQLIGDDAKKDKNDANTCSYSADSKGYSVTINSEVDGDGTQWDLTRKIGGPAEKVDGLGEEAFYRSGLATLYVRKGGVNIDVQIVSGPDSSLDEEKKLAGDVLK